MADNHELSIIEGKILCKNKLIKRYNTLSELEVLIPRNENTETIRLTPRKETIFSLTYSKNISQYLLIIPSLEFKTSRSRRGKCEYLDIEFKPLDQF